MKDIKLNFLLKRPSNEAKNIRKSRTYYILHQEEDTGVFVGGDIFFILPEIWETAEETFKMAGIEGETTEDFFIQLLIGDYVTERICMERVCQGFPVPASCNGRCTAIRAAYFLVYGKKIQ